MPLAPAPAPKPPAVADFFPFASTLKTVPDQKPDWASYMTMGFVFEEPGSLAWLGCADRKRKAPFDTLQPSSTHSNRAVATKFLPG
ncbi:hypothetical protein Y1Q_0016088 [Alligator mississippiensis]|uniref:Uncharacterized protein n=1 Tax=Alligator mississippiensis TaxID=8496 RepID=A0A151P189_ALLMI|nr:hypothetical protein Y1Q_0016088 [Alligator mississippiensis]